MFFKLPYELQDKILTFSNPFKEYYKIIYDRNLANILAIYLKIPKIYYKYLTFYTHIREINKLWYINCSCNASFITSKYKTNRIILKQINEHFKHEHNNKINYHKRQYEIYKSQYDILKQYLITN